MANEIWAIHRQALSRLTEAKETGKTIYAQTGEPAEKSVVKSESDEGEDSRLFLTGPMMRRPSLFYALAGEVVTDTDLLAAEIRKAAAGPSSRIVLDVDSPGGEVAGLDVLIEAINDAKEQKPIIAHVTGDCCSAALMVASAATEIVASEFSTIGSIGVYAVMPDYSKAYESDGIIMHVITNDGATVKGGGVPGTEIDEELLAHMKTGVNAFNDRFLAQLVDGRDMDMDELKTLNTGETWIASEALNLGLIDRISNKLPQQTQTKDDSKMLKEIKPLLLSHPERAEQIIALAEDGKDIDAINAKMKAMDDEDEMAQLKEEIEALRAENEELKKAMDEGEEKAMDEDEKAMDDEEKAMDEEQEEELAKANAALAAASIKIEQLKKFGKGAAKDTGAASADAPVVDPAAKAKSGEMTAVESANLVKQFLNGEF